MAIYNSKLLYVLAFTHILINSSDLPTFVETYIARLPRLQYDKDVYQSSRVKAHIICEYIFNFVPQKKSLQGVHELEEKIADLIEQNKSLSLLLLGFPFKSTNHEKKCISPSVDAAEYCALATLNIMIKNIQSIYPHAMCTIISDGLAYHIDNYDPEYEIIFRYHSQLESLISTHFPNLSFISWKVMDELDSYIQLQEKVSSIVLEPQEQNLKRYEEMKSFVSQEFNCMVWQETFLNEAKNNYVETEEKPKLRQQHINTLKNKIAHKKIEEIAALLLHKGAQFSIFVSNSYPHYSDCIRLSVHCDSIINVIKKIPISLIYGHQGTPWHNAIMVNKDHSIQLFKDKKKSLTQFEQQHFCIKTNTHDILLSYIKE